MKLKRKVLAALVAFAMLIGGLPVGFFDVHAAGEAVEYVKNGQELTCDDYTVIESSSKALTLTGGWYVIDGNVEIPGITLDTESAAGVEFNFILKDNSQLTIDDCIDQNYNSAILNIYGQSNGTGKLSAADNNVDDEYYGNGGIRVAYLNVYGGVVSSSTTNTYAWSRAINVSYMNIYDGTVTANGGGYGVYATDTISISGDSVVNANVNDEIASGDSGLYTYSGDITISDNAAVTAVGGAYGINSDSGKTLISGGDVIAQGDTAAVGTELTIEGNADVKYGEGEDNTTLGTENDVPDTCKYMEINTYVLDIFTKEVKYVEGEPVEEPLDGAKLSLIDSSNELVDTWTSGTEAYRIKSIAPGEYIINIDECPEGYYYENELNSVRQATFSVGDDGEITTDTLSGNSDDGFSINFSKIDNFYLPLKDNVIFEYGNPFGVGILDIENVSCNGEELSDATKDMLGQTYYLECKDSEGNTYNTQYGALVPAGEYTVRAISLYDPGEGPVTSIYDFGDSVKTTVVARVITENDIESVKVANKTYDGETKADVIITLKAENPQDGYTGGVQSDVNGKDVIEAVATANFVDPLPGDNKVVEYTITALTGEDAKNYTLPEGGISGTTTANITAKTVDKVNFVINSPIGGKSFVTEVTELSGADSAQIRWETEDGMAATGEAAYNTKYTAIVTLTAADSDVFISGTTKVEINGDAIDNYDIKDGKLVVSKSFATQKAKATGTETLDKITASNGTAANDLINKIPEKIVLYTEDGDREVEVDWVTTGIDYDESKLEKQTFEITGGITIPEDIDGNGVSTTVTQQFEVAKAGKVATPEINADDTYTEDAKVTITTETEAAKIFYTLDGTDPTDPDNESRKEYTGQIELKGEEGCGTAKDVAYNILAYAEKQGMYSSDVCDKKEVKITIPVEAPEVKITVKDSDWRQLLNTITFNKFFKETQNVTVTAEDNYSGVGTTEYYISKSGALSEEALNGNDILWTTYENGFTVSPEDKIVIYAKVTDASGNVTVVNTEGIVLYTNSAVVETDFEYIQSLGMEAVEVAVTFNDNTIDEIKLGGTVLETDDYTANYDNGTITFSRDYLDSLEAGGNTFAISYNPMGEKYIDAVGNDAPTETEITVNVIATQENEDGSVTADNNGNGEFGDEGDETYLPVDTDGDGEKDEYTEVTPNEDGSYTDENGTPDDTSDDKTYIPVDNDGDGKADDIIEVKPNGDGTYSDGDNKYKSNGNGVFVVVEDALSTDTSDNMDILLWLMIMTAAAAASVAVMTRKIKA